MGTIAKAYATIGEGQNHFRQNLSGSGASPLVLLHPSPASSVSMQGLMEALGDDRRLIAFDTPCNGQSCPPNVSEPEIAHFADMLDQACDALGLNKIALHDTHTGAHIAAHWAVAQPGRVKLFSLDGRALLSASEREEMLAHYAQPREPDAYDSQFS